MGEGGDTALDSSPVERLRGLLHKRFKVHLVDGRIFVGEFQSLDKQGNLVLGRAVEMIGPQKTEERQVGMALIPKAQQQTVQVEGSDGATPALSNKVARFWCFGYESRDPIHHMQNQKKCKHSFGRIPKPG